MQKLVPPAPRVPARLRAWRHAGSAQAAAGRAPQPPGSEVVRGPERSFIDASPAVAAGQAMSERLRRNGRNRCGAISLLPSHLPPISAYAVRGCAFTPRPGSFIL
jgi:hypothetical protein